MAHGEALHPAVDALEKLYLAGANAHSPDDALARRLALWPAFYAHIEEVAEQTARRMGVRDVGELASQLCVHKGTGGPLNNAYRICVLGGRHLPPEEQYRKLLAYWRTVAVSAVLDQMRAQKRRPDAESGSAEQLEAAPALESRVDEALTRAEERADFAQRLAAALPRLSPTQRQVFCVIMYPECRRLAQDAPALAAVLDAAVADAAGAAGEPSAAFHEALETYSEQPEHLFSQGGLKRTLAAALMKKSQQSLGNAFSVACKRLAREMSREGR